MFESKDLDGNDFRRLPSQDGIAMPRELFEGRFAKAIDVCISMCTLGEAGGVGRCKHVFGLEQLPYNGNQLFADEVVLPPNKGVLLADGLTDRAVLDCVWRYNRFPRYVHLGIEKANDREVHFLVQVSCCYCSVYDPKHPNPLFPVRVFGFITSVFRDRIDL